MFQNEQINFPLLIVIGTATFLVFIIGIFIIIKSYQKRIILNIREKRQLEAQFSQTLLQSQIEIQEQTLQHLSRELHDNLGQIASLIKINLNTIQLFKPDIALEKIENTKELTRQLITDLKSLSVSLSSDSFTQAGLSKAIETEVERLNKTGEFIASYSLQGTMPEIDKNKGIILYRMIQEALNNVVKHSSAKQIIISLIANEKLLILAIQDDGIGFSTEEKSNMPGAGFKNMENRALLINAHLTIKSFPGAGTHVRVDLPL